MHRGQHTRCYLLKPITDPPPGEPLSEQNHILQSCLLSNRNGHQVSDVNFLSEYAASLRELIKQRVNHKDTYHFPLAGLKIVVDAGNGSGGFFADQVGR